MNDRAALQLFAQLICEFVPRDDPNRYFELEARLRAAGASVSREGAFVFPHASMQMIFEGRLKPKASRYRQLLGSVWQAYQHFAVTVELGPGRPH